MSDLVKKCEFGLRARLLQELMDATMKQAIETKCQNGRQPKKRYEKEEQFGKVSRRNSEYRQRILRQEDSSALDTKGLVDSLVRLHVLRNIDAKLICDTRNKIAHGRLCLNEREFLTFYKDMKETLLDLGCCEKDYDQIRTCLLDSKRFQQRYNMQVPIADFFGRAEELERFHVVVEKLFGESADDRNQQFGIVVNGNASVGKSQFVWKYLQWRIARSEQEILNLFCLDASTWFSMDQSLRNLASHVNLKVRIGESMMQLFVRLSSMYARYKTVFLLENLALLDEDGADNGGGGVDTKFQELMQKFSNLDSYVFITTRFSGAHWQKYIDYVYVFPLDGFSPTDAIGFVKRELRKSELLTREDSFERDAPTPAIDESALQEFVRKCEYHPLIMQITLASLRVSPRLCATKYEALVKWNKRFSGITHSATDKNLPAREALIGALKQHDAYEFLNIVSILNCRHLRCEVLMLYAPTDVDFECMLNYLRQMSVMRFCITENGTDCHYTIPSIELQTIRAEVDVETAKKCFSVMFKVFEKRGNAHRKGVWDWWCEHYFSVFENFKQQSNVFSVFVNKTHAFREELAIVFEIKGATCHWQEVLEYLCGTQYPDSTIELQEMRLKVVDCYIKEGCLSAADELLSRIACQSESLARSPCLEFQVRYEKGRCLKEMGRLRAAMAIFHEIEPLTREYGRQIEVWNSTLVCLRKAGRFQEAKRGYLKLLKTLRKINRTDHVTRGNLAFCLQRLRQFQQATKIYAEVSEEQEVTIGTSHPSHLCILTNRAACLHERGRLGEALHWYDVVLEKHHELLGPSSQMYLTTMLWKGKCLHDYRRFGEAMDHYVIAMKGLRLRLGLDHPTYFHVLISMARCTGDMGEIEKAIEDLERLKPAISAALGSDHPHLLDIDYHVVQCTNKEGQHFENTLASFAKLSKRAKADGRDVVAMEIRSKIGECHLKLGRVDKALKLFKHLEQDQIKCYDLKNDPLLLETRRLIAQCLFQQHGCFGRKRRSREAIAMLHRVQELQVRELDTPNHPSVIDTEKLIRRFEALLDNDDFNSPRVKPLILLGGLCRLSCCRQQPKKGVRKGPLPRQDSRESERLVQE